MCRAFPKRSAAKDNAGACASGDLAAVHLMLKRLTPRNTL
jgi:hypothetical protein